MSKVETLDLVFKNLSHKVKYESEFKIQKKRNKKKNNI